MVKIHVKFSQFVSPSIQQNVYLLTNKCMCLPTLNGVLFDEKKLK